MIRLLTILLALASTTLHDTPMPDDVTVEGIDVSHYQGDIDWSKVKNDGIVFAIIKATQGMRTVDPRFKLNWAASKKAGLNRGAYHFLEPDQDGTAQAKHFLKTVNFAKGDLIPAVDVERKGEALTRTLKAFLAEVKSSLGVEAVIYVSPSFWNEHLADAFDAPLPNPLWIAEYGASKPKATRKIGPWLVWQYSQTGRVDGISGPVDRDRARTLTGDHHIR
jgi:lysozyme